MQLMPGTANEQAGKLGLSFSSQALIDDAGFNIQLGSAYFQRLMSYYNGSYPLAVAAYNAGAGNVNKWLRANGDPRTGGIAWSTGWNASRFRNAQLRAARAENAVVRGMNPDKASYTGANPMSHFLGKPSPG
jgi:soluble lytic murein transglycosylase